MAVGFLAVRFFAAGFFAEVRRLAVGFLAVRFFAAGFFAEVRRLAVGFLAVRFFAVGFLAVRFFAAGFLAVRFFAAGFLAAGFLAVRGFGWAGDGASGSPIPIARGGGAGSPSSPGIPIGRSGPGGGPIVVSVMVSTSRSGMRSSFNIASLPSDHGAMARSDYGPAVGDGASENEAPFSTTRRLPRARPPGRRAAGPSTPTPGRSPNHARCMWNHLRSVPAPSPQAGGLPRGSASLREIILGAQDNLINVLATVLGVAIGSGNTRIVALAGLASGLAEAISMGGVLYTSTSAERDLHRRANGGAAPPADRKDPLAAAIVTFAAALVAAAIPLAPFAVLPIRWAMLVAAAVSIAALFALGGYKGGVTGRRWWRDGLQFVAIGGLAALASALIGAALKTHA